MSMQGRIGHARGAKAKRALGVQAVLEWAFRVEKAQLELPPPKDVSEEGFGFGLEYVLLQRAALGCKVDGGQHKMGSYTHADAEIVAATVAGMPDSLGGIRMAISVAEMARAGMTPDWMPGVVPRCVPVEGIAAQLQAALADPSVRGIALDIDSFGGEVAGAFDLADRIRAARAQKPVQAFVAEHALSAGYVLASQADRIILPRTGAVGSIGVVALHTDMSGALDQRGIAVTLIHAGTHKIDANPYQPLPETVRDQMQRELEVVRFLFAETVAAGRGDQLTHAAALASEAAVFRGADAIAAGLADELADPVSTFRTFAAAPRGINPTSRKGLHMTTSYTDIPNPAPVADAAPSTESVAPGAPEPPVAAPAPTPEALAPDAPVMDADAIRAEAAEVAQVCAQAARLGVNIDAADAVTRGLKPEALRARVLADLAARNDAAVIIASVPAAAAAKDSPIITAARKAASDAKL